MLKSWRHNIKKMYRFEQNIMLRKGKRPKGFSLLEVVVALGVLAAICSAVLVVMNRCIAATIDSRTKMEAFKIVRENMEKVLGADSVTLVADMGVSETNPDIEWQTVIETFNEPVKAGMWLQAVCSATYTDSNGEKQTIELTHWLTELSDRDKQLIQKQRERELEYLEQLGPEEFAPEQFAPEEFGMEKSEEILPPDTFADDSGGLEPAGKLDPCQL